MDDNDYVCPLCCEELDISDRQFFPCKCGYQVCMWCWHRIRESESGLCPACRTPYGDDPHEFSAVDVEEVLKANKEKEAAAKREREKQREGSDDGSGQMEVPKDRTQLANMRVIRRNLVYAVGLPASIATEDLLRKPEYFGQYGKISKIVLNRSQTTGGDPRRASASAYVTFVHKEDTLACILALDSFYLEGRNIRASYGTSKYCSAFIKNVRCNNPECTYLHQMGDVEDTFTKQEIQAGYVTSGRDVLARQQQIVAQALSASSGAAGTAPRRRVGGGGPSGTGRSCANPVFPPPSYDEPSKPSTNLVPAPSIARSVTTGSAFPGVPAPAVVAGGKIVRASSSGPSVGAASALSKTSAGSLVPGGRKAAQNGLAPQGTTAASVVAGVHSASNASSEPPAPHTTLTPLTPLKRTTQKTGGPPPNLGSDSDLLPQNARRDASSRQNEVGKLTNLRNTTGTKKQSGGRGSQTATPTPGSPANSFSQANAIPSRIPSSDSASVSSIGGTVISGPGVSNGGARIGAIGVSLGSSGDLAAIGGSAEYPRVSPGSDVLGGVPIGGDSIGTASSLGGEVYTGELLSSAPKSAIGSGKDKWAPSQLGGSSALGGHDPVFGGGGAGGLWGSGNSSAPGGQNVLGSGIGGRPVGAIGSRNAIGNSGMGGPHTSGSSALASMLGINLPTGSGSLRESSNLWPSNGQSGVGTLNSRSVPATGVIGSGGAVGSSSVIGSSTPASSGLIGGIPIGGSVGSSRPAMNGPGAIGGGNKSDIALLQSLLPGVHITSGNLRQPPSSNFGAIGVGGGDAGWGSTPGGPTQGGRGSGALRDAHPGNNWGNGLPPQAVGAPVGPIGQGSGQQVQRPGPGNIW